MVEFNPFNNRQIFSAFYDPKTGKKGYVGHYVERAMDPNGLSNDIDDAMREGINEALERIGYFTKDEQDRIYAQQIAIEAAWEIKKGQAPDKPTPTSLVPGAPTRGYEYGIVDKYGRLLPQRENILSPLYPGQEGIEPVLFSAKENDVEIPTATTNPNRPRTVAAAYDASKYTMTIIFRDGTFYNYYGVDNDEWLGFKSTSNKGRYIKTYLDSKTRGPADVSKIDNSVRVALTSAAALAQRLYGGGLTPEASLKTKKGAKRKFIKEYTAARKANKKKY